MKTRLFWTIVATVCLVGGALGRASASDVSPLSPQIMTPVSDAGYSLTPVAEPPIGQLLALNEAAAAGAPAALGCACQGGGVPALAPQAMAESCSSCDAGSNGRVFDSCHLDNACGGDDCCDCCSTWCVRAGAVFLQRPTDPSRALVTNTVGGATVLNASQFTSSMQAGPDIDLIHHGSAFDLEARYFAVGQFTSSVGPNATAGATIQFATPIAAGATSVSGSESSQLWSLEFNVRKEVIPCFLTLLAGYRHIDLSEQIFGTTSLAGAPTDLFSTQAFNRLDGFQLGGEAVLWRPCCRFRVEGDAKVGVFGDATSNYGTNSVVGVGTAVATATGTHTAFMSEWGLTGVVQLTPHLDARVGYQGFLLDGVALASQQMGALNPLTPGTATTVNTGTQIYHGAVADLEYCW